MPTPLTTKSSSVSSQLLSRSTPAQEGKTDRKEDFGQVLGQARAETDDTMNSGGSSDKAADQNAERSVAPATDESGMKTMPDTRSEAAEPDEIEPDGLPVANPAPETTPENLPQHRDGNQFGGQGRRDQTAAQAMWDKADVSATKAAPNSHKHARSPTPFELVNLTHVAPNGLPNQDETERQALHNLGPSEIGDQAARRSRPAQAKAGQVILPFAETSRDELVQAKTATEIRVPETSSPRPDSMHSAQTPQAVNVAATAALAPMAEEKPLADISDIGESEMDLPGSATTLRPGRGDILASPSLQSAARAELARSVAGQMAAAITTRTGSGGVDVTLNPQELGRVSMILHTNDDGLTLAISAERPETMDLMRRHLSDLAQELRSAGFENISFEFGTGSDPSGGFAQDKSEPGGTRADEWVEPTANGETTPSLSATGVDMRL